MTQFKTINGLTFRVLEPLTIVGIIYFGVTFIMSKLIALLERRMNASGASEKELIRVEDLHKSFGSLQVLKGVTEHVNHGEVVSVIGPSGGGKSTFYAA